MGDNILLACFFLLPVVTAFIIHLFFKTKNVKATLGRFIAGNLLVLALLVSLILLGGELYYRFIYNSTDAIAVTKVSKKWLSRNYIKNDFGVRDSLKTYTTKKPPDKQRITFIGDSFTVGHGIADVEERFVNIIRQKRAGDEIHMIGANGLGTAHYLETIRWMEGFGYETDRVVMVYCLNDISDIVPDLSKIFKRARKPPAPQILLGNSYFLDILYYRIRSMTDPRVNEYDDLILAAYNGPIWDEQKAQLTRIKKSLGLLNVELMVVTFPYIEKRKGGYRYRDVHKRLDEFWKKAGVRHLDLLELFDAHSDESLIVNKHDMHPNERAHALAAIEIDKFLSRGMAKIDE